MKKIFRYLTILASVIISFCACTDDSEIAKYPNAEEGEKVLLKLTYNTINPSVIVARSEGTPEENKLRNLYVYIFSASDGKLKGFTKIEDSDRLNQVGEKGGVEVATTTGSSYIYAVANYRETNAVYSIDGLPTDINPDDAQDGVVNSIDLKGFKSLMFTRAPRELLISEYLMTGSANEGNECEIASNNGAGYIANPTTEDGKLIKLHRVVSKVQFNIKAGAGVEFIPTRYDIVNIPTKGSVVAGQQVMSNTFESVRKNVFSTQSRNSFEVKLPENLQTMKRTASSWHAREANTYVNDEITFDNAPDNGTYIILYGKFKDPTNKIEGDTQYYIHLGDCSSNVNDYNNERNCKYIYNVTVANVNKIIVEARKEGEPQPGAEGFILDYNAGKVFTLDSHYEYCVLKFSYDAIKTIKENSGGKQGYLYQVKALGKETSIINVASANDTLNADLNGVDISWIKFAQNDYVNDYDETDNAHGGKEFPYKDTKDRMHGNNKKRGELLTINALLLYLYDIANEENKSQKWKKDNNDQYYLTFTGYVKENYYQSLSWDQYTNIDPRVIYIADEVWASNDNKSTYAKVAYAVSQYSIQTFYDRNHSSSLIAYGCETINDEKGKIGISQINRPLSSKDRNDKIDALEGRRNMKADFDWSSNKEWNKLNYKDLREACMSRNRDLNRNGRIDDDEIRWYTPTVAQYTGLWIGEEALGNTDARLFTNNMNDVSSTSDPDVMHYYTSTHNARTYWAEEGMAYGNQTGVEGCKYVRCVRTLKSKDGTNENNDKGYQETPNEFYIIENNNKVISLENLVDEKALRTGTMIPGELPPHKERVNEASPDAFNKPRIKFLLAERRAGEIWGRQKNSYKWNWAGSISTFNLPVVLNETPCATYGQQGDAKGTLVDKGKWRVPNQREFCLMRLKDQVKTNDAARTGYTGSYRFGYRANPQVNMISSPTAGNLTVRCVRDYDKSIPTGVVPQQ